jgi:hypothetical protein
LDNNVYKFVPLKENDVDNKIVMILYGDKGIGKTTTTLALPGKILCLSFDSKSAVIWKTIYNKDERISIYNIAKKYIEAPFDDKLYEAVGAINGIYDLIGNEKWDWIVFDGLEILIEMVEAKMRYDNGIGPIEGFANLNIWKERKFTIRSIFNKAYTAVSKGILFTTYTEIIDEIIENGNINKRKKSPKWIDYIKYETDVVIYIYTHLNKDGIIGHYLDIESSKSPNFIEGKTIDISNFNYTNFIKCVNNNFYGDDKHIRDVNNSNLNLKQNEPDLNVIISNDNKVIENKVVENKDVKENKKIKNNFW